MFKNIFLKTLYEKRWATLWWSLIVFALTLATASLFPLFKDAVGSEVPKELQSLLGDSSAYSTVTGWLNLQVFDQMVFAGVIFGIIVGGSMIAGEESEGTLQSLLAQPVKRSVIYVQKFAALSCLVGALSFCLFAGSWLGVMLIGEQINVGDLFLAASMAFLLALFFAALTYAIGAITGRRGIAGALVGLLAFVGFTITSMAASINVLKYVDYLSPFHYYNKPSPLVANLQAADVLVLAIATAVLLIAGFIVFIRRDVYQR